MPNWNVKNLQCAPRLPAHDRGPLADAAMVLRAKLTTNADDRRLVRDFADGACVSERYFSSEPCLCRLLAMLDAKMRFP